MIWNLLIISLGLASARDTQTVEPEVLDALRASGQDEKFAELLGIQQSLVRPNNSEQRSEGSRYNHASFLGDILLTEEQEKSAMNFQRFPNSRWPGARIPYYIGGFTSCQRRFITHAINAFNARSPILKLVPRTGETDYVYVFSGNGCYTYLGRTGGQQALSLQQNGCLTVGTVHHEFLHVAGLGHEHIRSDRDRFVTVLWDNIPDNWRSQYQKGEDNYYILLGNYEYLSVMHYPYLAPDSGGKPAFRVPDGVDTNRLGQHDGATDEDIRKVSLLYS